MTRVCRFVAQLLVGHPRAGVVVAGVHEDRMNNAPSAARMPAAGTQALLSIRPGGQRLAAREVLAGRDRLERQAPGHGERLATRLPVWDRSSRRPSPAVHVLSAHRAAPKSGVHGHIADVAGSEFRPVTHKRRPVKPFRAGNGFAPESIWTPYTSVAPKQTSSTESAICACRAALNELHVLGQDLCDNLIWQVQALFAPPPPA